MSTPDKGDVAPKKTKSTTDYFNFDNCKYHTVDMLESEYIQAVANGTRSMLATKGYIFPILTKGGRLLLKHWDTRTLDYFDKHMPRELIDPRFPVATRPKIILKLKYPDRENVGGWMTCSPKEFIEWNFNNCKKQGFEPKQQHLDNWQEWLDKLTFLKRD